MNRPAVVSTLARNRDRILRFRDAEGPALLRTYGPGKWSVNQMLAHVADTEFINLWRFCRAVAEPGASVEAFEEANWANALGYAARPARLSLDLFAAARGTLIHYAESLPDERLERACEHPEKGAMTGWQWLELNPAHCDHHAGQIEAALAGTTWTPKLTPDSWKFGAGPRPA